MQIQIKRWGNGQGIRLSQSVLREANLKVDDFLQVSVEGSNIVLHKCVQHKTLKERAAQYGGELHLSDEIDWGESAGDEVD